MTIAAQKKEENIVEYVLYLWQMHDLVRAADFDLSAIRAFLSSDSKFDNDLDVELEWFAGLIKSMKSHKLEKKGHIPEIDNILVELSYLHHTLIEILKDADYLKAWERAQPNLADFLKKSGNQNMPPIEAAMTAMYGMLVLRLQKKEMAPETKTAIDTFRKMLVLLAKQYRDMRSGSKHFSLN